MGALGCRGHEKTYKGHINTAKRVENGHTNPNLNSMVGAISPEIIFWEGWQKWTRTFTDVCR